MQYSLPQFVDVEDKIIDFPPLTIKQFLAFVVCGILFLIYWFIFDIGTVFFLLAIPTLFVAAVLTFAKFNGRPVLANAPNLVRFYLAPKQRIFVRLGDSTSVIKKLEKPAGEGEAASAAVPAPPITSRLRSLAYLLDEKAAEEERLLRTGGQSGQWLDKI